MIRGYYPALLQQSELLFMAAILNIPESKGAGFLTGFWWGSNLRMMIRNYYLKEDVVVSWTNEAIL